MIEAPLSAALREGHGKVQARYLRNIPALCASLQAALCVKLLTGRPIETGRLLYFDLLNQEFESIPLLP